MKDIGDSHAKAPDEFQPFKGGLLFETNSNKYTMNLTGKLTRILPLENGTSKAGKDWQKQSFVLEYQDGNYSKLACIQVKNEMMISMLKQFKIGDTLSCEVKIEAREWQDRFYTDVIAWRINKTESDDIGF